MIIFFAQEKKQNYLNYPFKNIFFKPACMLFIFYITEPTKDQCLKNIYSSFYSSFKIKTIP